MRRPGRPRTDWGSVPARAGLGVKTVGVFIAGMVGVVAMVLGTLGLFGVIGGGDPKLDHAASCRRFYTINQTYDAALTDEVAGESRYQPTPARLGLLDEYTRLADRTADDELRDALNALIDLGREHIREQAIVGADPRTLTLIRRVVIVCPHSFAN